MRWRAVVALVLALAAVAGVAARADAPTLLYPDLVADPPERPLLATSSTPSGNQLLLRFDGFIHNVGQGPLDLRGSRATASDPMPAIQRIKDDAGGWHNYSLPSQFVYVDADGHHHWHLDRVAKYSLFTLDGSALVAPAMKVGFCLGDIAHVDAGIGPSTGNYTTAGTQFCRQNQTGALDLYEGVDEGWRDVYSRNLAFQWVDVSDVQPGEYRLAADVDPDNFLTESNESNPTGFALTTSVIPGYVAVPFSRPLGQGGPLSLIVAAQTFGAPGPVSYRLERAPAHGTLTDVNGNPVGAGQSFGDPHLTYTPAAGWTGGDDFTYSARDASSEFPRHPAVSTVTLSAGPAVHITAPDAVVAGTATQLQADVVGDQQSVSWSVDGGSITPGGLFTAPPAAGAVTVVATSPSGAQDQRRIEILPPTAPQSSPLTMDPAEIINDSRTSRLGTPTAKRIGTFVVIGVMPRVRGTIRLSATALTIPLGACKTTSPAGRLFTCKLKLKHGRKVPHNVRVTASLRVSGHVKAVRARLVPLG